MPTMSSEDRLETSHRLAIEKTCPSTGARAGWLHTARGPVPTPLFMPVGSQGCVKTLKPEEVAGIGIGMILANTYHLYLRPGIDAIQTLGGLHHFTGWDRPMLTDSGGYQVFSLASLRSVNDEGVTFKSHIDGSEHFFTPGKVVQFQERLGADVIMPLDHCPPYTLDRGPVREATDRTHTWAAKSLKAFQCREQALYGIVQGGVFSDMRRESSRAVTDLGFSGYAIGGLSIGEPKNITLAMVEETVFYLPADKPRYLMGVGSPEDILESVARGVDLFDSALPTRTARNGALFTADGRRNILNARFRLLDAPIDNECDCGACRCFSAAYLHHLFKTKELLGYRLATIHNLRFIARLMDAVRRSIVDDEFVDFKRTFLSRYQTTDEEMRLAQKQKWLNRPFRASNKSDSS